MTAVRSVLTTLAPGQSRASPAEVEGVVAAGRRALRRRRTGETLLLAMLVVAVAVAGFLTGAAL